MVCWGAVTRGKESENIESLDQKRRKTGGPLLKRIDNITTVHLAHGGGYASWNVHAISTER